MECINIEVQTDDIKDVKKTFNVAKIRERLEMRRKEINDIEMSSIAVSIDDHTITKGQRTLLTLYKQRAYILGFCLKNELLKKEKFQNALIYPSIALGFSVSIFAGINQVIEVIPYSNTIICAAALLSSSLVGINQKLKLNSKVENLKKLSQKCFALSSDIENQLVMLNNDADVKQINYKEYLLEVSQTFRGLQNESPTFDQEIINDGNKVYEDMIKNNYKNKQIEFSILDLQQNDNIV